MNDNQADNYTVNHHGSNNCVVDTHLNGAQVTGAQIVGVQVVGAQATGAQAVGAQVVDTQAAGAQAAGAQSAQAEEEKLTISLTAPKDKLRKIYLSPG